MRITVYTPTILTEEMNTMTCELTFAWLSRYEKLPCPRPTIVFIRTEWYNVEMTTFHGALVREGGPFNLIINVGTFRKSVSIYCS